jgi:hypothetical protein
MFLPLSSYNEMSACLIRQVLNTKNRSGVHDQDLTLYCQSEPPQEKPLPYLLYYFYATRTRPGSLGQEASEMSTEAQRDSFAKSTVASTGKKSVSGSKCSRDDEEYGLLRTKNLKDQMDWRVSILQETKRQADATSSIAWYDVLSKERKEIEGELVVLCEGAYDIAEVLELAKESPADIVNPLLGFKAKRWLTLQTQLDQITTNAGLDSRPQVADAAHQTLGGQSHSYLQTLTGVVTTHATALANASDLINSSRERF